jgi:16S rRNA C967 or C1407 C5-methylase (RsmB/RsmF family)/NOL1/NOP2/fmu family ribosome biogenesis protein
VVDLPEKFIRSLTGLAGYDEDAFRKVHSPGEPATSVRINLQKPLTSAELAERGASEKIPWTNTGYYLSNRPSFTFDPLFHAGCYYVQEASSMFLEQAVRQTTDMSKPLRVLDLCAAPGGKSTHLLSLLPSNSLLVSNEVIRSRSTILRDNIIKWGYENVIVTSNDPKDFAALENYFDVLLVDAPCSGSGLFRKDAAAIEEWSEHNVELCCQRQQRILADAWPCLKKNGILIYATCSYSKQEDEDILDWIQQNFVVDNVFLHISNDWGITASRTATGQEGYRFWPDKVKGEGFFLAAFRKTEGDHNYTQKIKNSASYLSKKDAAILDKWIASAGHRYFVNHDEVYILQETFIPDYNILSSQLRIIYSGIQAGTLIKEKLLPAHALAMSNLLIPAIASLAVTREQAVLYLQKKDMNIASPANGWQLVHFHNHPLGWINALPNRINNYYPKELRILKDSLPGAIN